MARNTLSKNSKRVSIKKTLNEFAEHTTIHGIGYIFNAMIPFFERCIWAVFFGSFAFLAMFWSVYYLNQWQKNPVLTSIKSTGTTYLVEINYLLFEL